MKAPTILTPDGRRAWSFVAIWIGCVVFTVFAAIAVWLVSGNAYYSLILGLAAHAQLFVGMGAFAFVLGRRMMFAAGKDGVSFDDREPQTPAEGAHAAAGAAEKVAQELDKGEAG